jgi:hypothetical protein
MAFRAFVHVLVASSLLAAGCSNGSQQDGDGGHDPDIEDDPADADEDADDGGPDAADGVEEDVEDADEGDEVSDLVEVEEVEEVEEAEDMAEALDADEIDEIEDLFDGEVFDPYPAPNFTLVDVNLASSTYHDIRTLSGARGKVLVLNFTGFS